MGVDAAPWTPWTLAGTAHIGAVRISLRWSQVETAPGVWNFSAFDQPINDMYAQGYKVLAMLNHVPSFYGGGSNGNIPPSNIALWEEYVRRVAQRYRGKIEAYEIWNEPDLVNSGDGIGWNKDINSYPRYPDYLRAAALQIRTHAPGTLVVGPALSSGDNSRTPTIFSQIEQTSYPEGPASSFLDIISIHANAKTSDSCATAGNILYTKKLTRLTTSNPSNRCKPIWITEFGWATAHVSQSFQSSYIGCMVHTFTGNNDWGCYNWLNWYIPRAFIYRLRDGEGNTRGIFNLNGTPKTVVTQFLQPMAFPATYSPFYYPN